MQRRTGDGEHEPLPVPSVRGRTPGRIGANVAICVNKVAAAPGLRPRLTQCPAAANSPGGTRVLPRVISHRQGAGTGRLCVWSLETWSERGAVLSQPCQGPAIARPRGRSGRRQPALTFRELGHHFAFIFLRGKMKREVEGRRGRTEGREMEMAGEPEEKERERERLTRIASQERDFAEKGGSGSWREAWEEPMEGG